MRTAAFLALALLALSGIALADLSVGNFTILPSAVRPGIVGTISMTVSNPESYDAQGVIGEAFGNDNVLSAGRTGLGDFKPGVSTILSFPFSVPIGTKAGIYTIQYTLSWTNINGTRLKTLYLPVMVSNPPIFSLESDDKIAYTNADFIVKGKIYNSGGMATSVRIQSNSDKVIQTGQTPKWIGDVDENATFEMSFTAAPGTSSGSYSVPVQITARDEIGQEAVYNATLRIAINRRAPAFVLVAQADKPLTIGAKTVMSVKLTNTGDDDAYQVRMTLPENGALTPIGITELDIGTLKAGEGRTIPIEVGVNNVQPGFYSQQFLVRYHNKEGEAQDDKNVSSGINIEGKNEVSVFISAKPSPLVAGGAHTLSVLVSNIGSAPIKALTVKIGDGFFMLQEAQDTQFIGGLSEDDFSTVQYKVRVDDNAMDGTYPFNVTMTFKDAYNVEHNITKTEHLSVLSRETAAKLSGSSGGISPVVAIIVLAALAAGAYFAYKRFRQAKKA